MNLGGFMDNELVAMINRRIDDSNDNNNRRFDTLEDKVDSLLKFKWQIFGASAVVTLIVTFVFQLLSVPAI